MSRPKFNPLTDVPDLTGKVAIVTGGGRGMGFHITQQLYNHGAKVYIAARDERAVGDVIRLIEGQQQELEVKGEHTTTITKGKLVFLHLDLSTIQGARDAADRFLEVESRIDILIHNAGIMSHDYGKTKDGLEDTLAVNHFAPFTFTQRLLPLLISTSKLPGADVRVVTVSSEIHSRAPPEGKFLTLDEINDPLASPESPNGIFARYARYARSKLANILFASELQRKFESASSPALSISVNPGGVATETVLKSAGSVFLVGPILRFVVGRLAQSPLDGACTALFAATSRDVRARDKEFSGAYLVPYGKIATVGVSDDAKNVELAGKLWESSRVVTERILSGSARM